MSLNSSTSNSPAGKVSSPPSRPKKKSSRFKKYPIGVLVVLLIFLLISGPGKVSSSSGSIPTFSIQSVVTDQTVTILTKNFPAGQTFSVTMGVMGSLGIDGYLVANTNSGAGGTFTATYDIPEPLKGSYQIAIRLQNTQGYYAYNWFYNNTTDGRVSSASSATTSSTTSSLTGTSGYIGDPTFSIQSVATDETVTILTNNFPANQTFTVTMGAMGTRGINGIVIDKLESGKGGALTATFTIPDALKGNRQISIRAQTAHANPYYAYNWFYNNTTAVSPPDKPDAPAETPDAVTPVTTPYYGIPTIHMCSVVRDKTVMFRTSNFPPNQTFTVRMGAMWTAGIGGYVVGSFNSNEGGTFEQTFDIPSALAGSYKISIRTETGHANPYYTYNWFYNSTASVCN